MTEDIFKYIDVERTIAEFGYDPRELGKSSHKKVYVLCSNCGNPRGKNGLPIGFFYAIKDMICKTCSMNNITLKNVYISKNEEIYKNIDIEETILSFGYDPRNITFGSARKVIKSCPDCKKNKAVEFSAHVKAPNATCYSCSNKKRFAKRQEIHTKESLGSISIERTEQVYGYNPLHLYKSSAKLVICICKFCKEETSTLFSHAKKRKSCAKCQKIVLTGLVRTSETKAKLSSIRKGKCSPRQLAALKELGLKQRGKKITGWNLERRFGKNNPRYGKTAANVTGAWYIKKDESKVWMRSSWEIKYAKHLDMIGTSWIYEPKAFEITYFCEINKEKKQGTYRPDFLLDNGNWVEVKGFWRKNAKPKFEAFKAQYPDEKITLLMKPELLALGIEL